jgi:hypothetical protein
MSLPNSFASATRENPFKNITQVRDVKTKSHAERKNIVKGATGGMKRQEIWKS